jgi:heme-degrading monooxygenase HmoA
MHARVGIIQVHPGKMDEFVRIFRDAMSPSARTQKGYKGVIVLTDRDAGKVIGFSLWETEADARAMETSGVSFQAQADKLKDIIVEVPATQYFEVSYQRLE